MTKETIRIGFAPLVDCALLAIAQECSFFAQHHLDVELRKAQSWSQVRDKLLTREWDASHLLITMPLQFALAAPDDAPPVGYAFTLSRNGNGIILANALWNDGVRDAAGLASWMEAHRGRVLRLGVVFPRGTQEYFLRSWLARAGLGLGDRIVMSIIAPQEMVGRLRKGEIDGFCAGEPWSRRAAASKLGRLVAESGGLFPGLGEKVLGVRADWHRGHTLEHARLMRALAQAAAWLADPGNRQAAVDIVASKHYVNTPKSVVEGALTDAFDRDAAERRGGNAEVSPLAGANPHEPAQSHARWYLDQMMRWGHADASLCRSLDLQAICLEHFHRSVSASLAQSPKASGPNQSGPQSPAVTGLAVRA